MSKLPVGAVNTGYILDDLRGNNSQNIIFHVMIVHQPGGMLHQIKCTAAGSGMAHGIVDLLRAVYRKPDEKMMLLKKSAPFFIDRESIRLKSVVHLDMVFIILLLKGHRFFKKIQSAQGRLSALEGIADHALRAQDRPADDIF